MYGCECNYSEYGNACRDVTEWHSGRMVWGVHWSSLNAPTVYKWNIRVHGCRDESAWLEEQECEEGLINGQHVQNADEKG